MAGLVPEAMLVFARQQRGACRATHWTGDVTGGEPCACLRHRVEVWRRSILSAVAAEFTVTQVVGENDDDVGLGRGLGGFDAGNQGKQDGEDGQWKAWDPSAKMVQTWGADYCD